MFNKKTKIIKLQKKLIETKDMEIEALQSVICPNGHDWHSLTLGDIQVKQCDRCGKIEKI